MTDLNDDMVDNRHGDPRLEYDDIVDADGNLIPGLDADVEEDDLPSIADILRRQVHG